jgi:hypothetical protein
MDKMTRQGIHDLLDRVLDGVPAQRFVLTRFVGGSCNLIVWNGEQRIEQESGWSSIGELVTRAKEATDE